MDLYGSGEDPKSALNHFCQDFCRRPVTKEDIVYTTSKFGNQYQTIVKLNCLGGQEYAGNLSGIVKEAEKEAALQALQAYASTIASMPAPNKDAAKKRKTPQMISPAEQAEKKARLEAGENPAFTPKVKLNSLCMKIAKRFLQKGDTVYECMTVPGGYQATVKLSCLPGEWKDRVWAGHVCNTKQKAEQSAAEIALDQITEDKELNEEANKTPPKGGDKAGKGAVKGMSGVGIGMGMMGGACAKAVGPKGCEGCKGCKGFEAKGKGVSKGWGGPSWGGGKDWGGADWGADSWNWGPPPWMWQQTYHEGKGGGKEEAYGGGGSSRGKWSSQSNSTQARHRISDEAVLGEVLEWKGQYAWVKPHTPIQHTASKAHGGKVYVHKKDLCAPLTCLQTGQTVQFQLYEDGNGIGGEEVQVV